MSVLCSVSERIHSYLPEEAQVLFHAFKNMNKSNQLESNTSHFAKLSWHDWTDLLVKLGFYGGIKVHRWKGAEWGAIIVLSRLLYFYYLRNRNRNCISINWTAIILTAANYKIHQCLIFFLLLLSNSINNHFFFWTIITNNTRHNKQLQAVYSCCRTVIQKHNSIDVQLWVCEYWVSCDSFNQISEQE